MHTTTRLLLTGLLATGTAPALAAQGAPIGEPVGEPVAPAEFAPVLAPAAPSSATRLYRDDAAVRRRGVVFRSGFFAEGEPGRSAPERIALELFEDRTVWAVRERVELARSGTILVYAPVGEESGRVYLSIVGESVTGTIRLHDGLFKIQSTGGGHHTVLEIDESRRLPCGADQLLPHRSRSVEPVPTYDGTMPSDTTADLMVLYTDDARDAHGEDGILSLINLAVFEGNEALASSDVNLRLDLVHTAEVQVNVGNGQVFLSEFLYDLADPLDGIMDEIHAWRDEHAADCVHLVIDNAIGCGVSWTMQDLDVSFEESAFSVAKDNCITGEGTFIHELGHTFGCAHEQGNGQGGVFPFSRGYRTPSQEYRTVMSDSPGERLLYFSTPNHEAPNGEVLGRTETDTLPAHNELSINLAASTIASFRVADEHGKRLTTHFEGDNGSGGNMFDLQPKTDLNITGMNIWPHTAPARPCASATARRSSRTRA